MRDLELSSLDADKTISIYLKQEEKYLIFFINLAFLLFIIRIPETEAYIQYAVLYNNPYGQRVIRVINMSFQVNNSASENFFTRL